MVSTVTRALQELKDFSRIHFKKGETKPVSLTITEDKLQYFAPGEFEVQAGKILQIIYQQNLK